MKSVCAYYFFGRNKGHFFRLCFHSVIHKTVRIYDFQTKTFHEATYGFGITKEIPSFLPLFPEAIYDCSSLYTKNYKISGEYKLPKDDFLGTPELNVCITPVSYKACLLWAHFGGA